MTYRGPRYIQIDTPCPSVWGFPSDRTLEVGRSGVESGLVPLYEMENGEVTGVNKIKKRIPVEQYLQMQGRFKHLFVRGHGTGEIDELQELADTNIVKYGLLKTKQEDKA